MNKKIRFISLFLSAIFLIAVLSGCSSRGVEAAKQIESKIEEQQAKANSYINIKEENIDVQNAINIISELSSEKYKGRKTGSKENEIALQYISNQFITIGLKNPQGLENYMQYYYQIVTHLKETPKLRLLDMDGNDIKDFEYPRNFVYRVLSDSTEDINIKAPMQVMSSIAEIKNHSFENQEVLLFSSAAQGRSSMMAIVNEIYDTKASAIIIEVDVDSENKRYSDLIVTPLNRRWGESYKPVITVDSATYAELAQAATEQKMIDLQFSSTEENYKTANVVGYIPGTDEELKDEYIIIGGHMDHVGDNLNGTYNPGAFDNASGTAAMIEIARIISENDIKPKKTLVFIAFNGEEYGLIGSECYAAEPVFPIKNAVMINLDMVGSSAIVPLSIATSMRHVLDLRSEFLELGKSLGIDTEESDLSASDHFSFGEKSVPTVMLTHMDDKNGYHSPNDTMEDVDRERLNEVIELVLHYIDKKAY